MSIQASLVVPSIVDTLTSYKTIVFIDAGVEEPNVLAQGVIPGAEVHLLGTEADAIAQITAALSDRADLGAVHIISHGAPGHLLLGNGELSLNNLTDHAEQLATWFAASQPNHPELLLYGCNVAAGEAGATFIARLQALSGARISAASHRVGAANHGGQWNLNLGNSTTPLALTQAAQANYTGTFQVNLTPGDVAVVAYGADAPDHFGIVTLRDIPAGSVLFITDKGFDTATGRPATSDESTITLTVGSAGISAGSVITNSNIGSFGTTTGDDLSFLTVFGDQILVYQTDDGTEAGNPSFIYAFNNSTFEADATTQWQATATTVVHSGVPTGLTAVSAIGDGGTAFGLIGEVDNAYYSGPLEGTKAQLLAFISTPSNWTTSDSPLDFTAAPTQFTVLNAAPTIEAQSFDVVEDSADGTLVGTVVATDEETPNDLSFSITEGNNAGFFAINQETGAITLTSNANLDFESGTTSYQLAVTATETTGNNPLQKSAIITINVTDDGVNTAPTLEAQSFNVVENSTSGTVVGTVVASDAETPNALSFSITEGNNAGFFAIDNNGAITLTPNANLDFEGGTTSYQLAVAATETTGAAPLQKSAVITINVTDDASEGAATATSASLEWNTVTSVVSAFSIDLPNLTAELNPIGRTIEDTAWQLQTTGDLNGDGQDDVLLRNFTAGLNLAWYMEAGGQAIASEGLIGRTIEDPNWSLSGTGDFDGDGNVDIVLRNEAADQIVAWYMDGSGNILREDLIGRGFGDNNWKIEAAADFNGDGKADLLLRNGVSGQNLLWEMDGGTILSESLFGRDIPDVNWHIEGVRDFDSNGTIDVLLRQRSAGQALLWLMEDKNTIASETLISGVPGADSQLVF